MSRPIPRDELNRKRCSTCKVYKDETGFPAATATRDGLHHRCKVCSREARLVCRYGLTLAALENLLEVQSGQCAICNKTLSITSKTLNVDHDHETNIVRGLLCQPCNAALGLFEEDISRMKAAIAYLEKHNADA